MRSLAANSWAFWAIASCHEFIGISIGMILDGGSDRIHQKLHRCLIGVRHDEIIST
jgi:hypothetical protein